MSDPLGRYKLGLLMIVMLGLGMLIGRELLPRPDPLMVGRKDEARIPQATPAPDRREVADVKPGPIVPPRIAVTHPVREALAVPEPVKTNDRSNKWPRKGSGLAKDIAKMLNEQQAEFDAEQEVLRLKAIRDQEKEKRIK